MFLYARRSSASYEFSCFDLLWFDIFSLFDRSVTSAPPGHAAAQRRPRPLKFSRISVVFFYSSSSSSSIHHMYHSPTHTGLKQRQFELKDSNNKPNKKEQSHLLKHYVGDLLVQSTILVIVERLFCL